MISTLLKTATAALLLGAACMGAIQPAQAEGPKDGKKYKIYLSLSYSGNAWQSEAANIVKALAATPPYNDMVELKEVISGADPQAQISAYESMIDAGADGIVSFPISATALNRTIKRGCEQGVLFFMYDATVTESCAYNVSYLSSGFGENSAQALVNSLGGKGKIFLSRGVPGNSVDQRHTDGAKHIFAKYPGIEVVSEYYSYWDDRTTQQETAKALAAHPDVQGIWAQAGEYGAIQALLDKGGNLVPVTGENSNGFRLALADPAMQAKGLTGVSAGSPPAQSGYAFKLMMEILTGKRELKPTNIEYPLPWVPADKVKLCAGDKFENGCNVFPKDRVPSSFVTEVLNPVLLPELNIDSALNGTPVKGATIQPLPAEIVKAANEPGINCSHCEAAPDQYKLTKIAPTVN
ncbi:ribose transport system substrate-binding protein [Pseudoxanthobacter soli DSM 19599]|uniref:Ribose transport system substrate-binding protein n=1 Tax=Pseudoxanthobacter soli DSM 19599 TaxID=1123029 RepID=A0A1M7ZQ17_9HYPH|nr:sugar ABC transporter substrate-binding protein [Pseudoxanthobacter soli]SHO66985.1 ribose transport system substrate-binding protein [Pseudoxanthobacter soli DSM 19599]